LLQYFSYGVRGHPSRYINLHRLSGSGWLKLIPNIQSCSPDTSHYNKDETYKHPERNNPTPRSATNGSLSLLLLLFRLIQPTAPSFFRPNLKPCFYRIFWIFTESFEKGRL